MQYERGRVGRGWVKWLYAAVFAACMVGCGDDEWEGKSAGETSGVLRKQGSPIRLRAPLSGSVSASRQPVFAFTPERDARVDICYDRACEHVLESLDGRDGEAQPETPLPAGTFFWRAVDAQAGQRDLAARHPVARKRADHRVRDRARLQRRRHRRRRHRRASGRHRQRAGLLRALLRSRLHAERHAVGRRRIRAGRSRRSAT